MQYYLLTGSTGLLGRYLLRDFLLAGARVAVLARPTRQKAARDRIEEVMTHWESLEGRALPRPVIFDADTCHVNAGLDAGGVRWIKEHCRALVHSAASMKFRPDKLGDPARTNVDGTRHVLELCRTANIREFHHVSTAYVCGLRAGRILESELDLGQEFGNIYEKSKLEGEKLLREAGCLDVLNVYRPGSIVGDSQTGYTTNYHGFYLPLQLACATAANVPPDAMGDRFRVRLGLEGDEGKNLVPVDWVSTAIVYLVLHPEHRNQTFHLTSSQPVPVQMIQEIVPPALRQYFEGPIASSASEEALSAYEKLFEEYMSIYQSHWRNDPVFDRAATDRAAGHLPCPKLDRQQLLCLAKFAIENNFNPPRCSPATARFDAHAHLEPWVRSVRQRADSGAEVEAVSLQVNGRGGGQWHLVFRQGRLLGANPGLGPQSADGYYLNADTFAALVCRRVAVEQAICAGRLLIQGHEHSWRELIRVFEQLVSSSGLSHAN